MVCEGHSGTVLVAGGSGGRGSGEGRRGVTVPSSLARLDSAAVAAAAVVDVFMLLGA